jgi:hypothetical protein
MQVLGALMLASAVTLAAPGPAPSPVPADSAAAGAGTVADGPAMAAPTSLGANDPPAPAAVLPETGAASLESAARRGPHWPEVWGILGGRGFFYGQRMPANGQPYAPLFTMDLDFNVGLLPGQRLYLFGDSSFWAEKAGPNVTNPSQGSFDFSKREWNFTVGVAWNVAGPVELRAFGYALNNLNRGVSTTAPSGYADGTGVEARWYLPAEDRYDVARRSFVSLGYLPTKTLIDANGNQFAPGAFARAYLTADIPWLRSYVFFDGEGINDNGFSPRLLYLDTGLAVRPFLALPALEFRLGGSDTYDARVQHNNRVLVYGAIRILF